MKYLKIFEEFSDFYKKIRNDDIEYKKIVDIYLGIKDMIESRLKYLLIQLQRSLKYKILPY
jgi:hypothetical protein